jgi:transcriptional regulator with XRE-family HTH domain
MEKSKFTEEYELLLVLLRDTRKRVGITQVQIAETLAWTQSVVSKCERGERRLDAIELRQWVLGLGVSFPGFLAEFETLVSKRRPMAKQVVRRGNK